MGLQHTILAALLEEPRTGYELAKQFGTDGHFWHATHQQIYRELSRLEATGAIRSLGGVGPRGDQKREATDLGRTQLRDWALRPAEAAEIKEDLLIKCLLLGMISHRELASQIATRRRHHSVRLLSYETVSIERFPEEVGLDESMLGRFLALHAGILYEKAWIEWADAAIRLLTASEMSKPNRG